MIKKMNWDDVAEEQVNPMMKRKLIYGDKIMIGKIKFKDGFVVPLHSHENEQITQVTFGSIRFWLGEDKKEVIDVHEGESIVIPANLPHEALMIGDVEETDTWAPPRTDWLDGTDHYLKK
jgi:quercetin dioxygenase-like cupin family protein